MRAILLAMTMPAFNGLLATAEDAPSTAEQYAAVDAAVTRTLEAIRADLIKIAKTEGYPQLQGVEKSTVQRQKISWIFNILHHSKQAEAVAAPRKGEKAGPSGFSYGKDGCRIHVDLRTYDAETDPRAKDSVMSASPPPQFQAKGSGVPFGVEYSVEAEPTEEGRKFVAQVNEAIAARIDELKKELEATPVEFDELLEIKMRRIKKAE